MNKIVFLCCLMSVISFAQAGPVKTTGTPVVDQKIKLGLLESIAPQRHEGEGDIITSNLGEILEDPRNETLKAVKVLGRKKRIQGDSQKVTQIIWEEVALDAEPSAEMAARGVQVPVQNSLKEPVKKPLHSAFRQKSEVIESGTPIEAKGDVDGLLAAARSLLIRAQKQGYKVIPTPVVSSSSFRGSSSSTQKEATSSSGRSSSEQERKESSERGSLREDKARVDKTTTLSSEQRAGEVGEEVKKPKTSERTTPYKTSARDSPYQDSSQSTFLGPSSSDKTSPSFVSSSGSPYQRGMEFTSNQPWSKRKEEKGKGEGSSTPVVIKVSEGGDGSETSFQRKGRTQPFEGSSFKGSGDESDSEARRFKTGLLSDDDEEGLRKSKKEEDLEEDEFSSTSRGGEYAGCRKGSRRSDDPEAFSRGRKTRSSHEESASESDTVKTGSKSKESRIGSSSEDDDSNLDSKDEPARSSQYSGRTRGKWRSKDTKLKGAKGKEISSDDEEGWTSEDQEGDFNYPFGKRKSQNDQQGTKVPVIEVKYDFDSCTPRIDWGTKQVILQARAITFRNNKKITESECADTPKRFAIQKDYSCDLCQDVVEKKHPPSKQDLGFAFATYRPYWLDESSQKTYLKDAQKDEKYPFALQEESGKCTYKVDLDDKIATPQSELVYYNRAKQKVVVEGCRPTLEADPVSITATQKGCGIVHDFDQNRSIQQQRLLYTVDGVGHEVVPCHDVGNWMRHEFDLAACKPFIDNASKMQQPMARRFIITPHGKTYLSECEPYGQKAELAVDYDICVEKPFHHDVPAKQSFRNGRYYYEHPSKGRKYVTPCHPLTNETFVHKKTLVGYEHNDQKRISKSKVEVSIEVDGRKVVVVPPHIEETATEVPYTKQKEKVESTAYQTKMTDRCHQEQRFKKYMVYQRIDGSEYLERADDKVQSIDRCKREKETLYEQAFVTHLHYLPDDPEERQREDTGGKYVNQLPWGGVGILTQHGYHEYSSHNMYHVFPAGGWLWRTDKEMERIKTIYPDSSIPEYSAWNWTGYYKDHSVQGCNHGGGGPYPSVEEKRWHHSERKF